MGRAYLPEDWIRNQSVSPQARCLAALLSSYANGEYGDQDVWPSPDTLAKSLGMSTRNLTRLGDEGQAAGWWTRLYERNFRGGTELTWRLHFPAFTPSGHGTDTEATSVSVGRNHSAKPADTEQTASGHGTDTERTPVSAGRYEGTKDGRNEGEPLSLTAPQQPAKKRRAKFVPPTEAEVKEVFVAKGMPEREAVHEATKFCGHHESKGWAKIVDWRAAAGKTWFTNWKKWNPQLDTTQRYYLEPASKLDEFGRVIA